MDTPTDWLEAWYAALAAPDGLILTIVGSQASAVQNLYQARKAAGDPQLDTLFLSINRENESEIRIIPKVVDLPDEEQPPINQDDPQSL